MKLAKAITGFGVSFGLDGFFHIVFGLGMLAWGWCSSMETLLNWFLGNLLERGNDIAKTIAAVFITVEHIKRGSAWRK